MTRKTEGPNPARFDDELVGENATKAPPEHQLLWFVGLIVTALLVGFFLAIGLFIATFLKVRTELPNRTIAIMTACGLGALASVGYVLSLDYPAGLLPHVDDLPWPMSTAKEGRKRHGQAPGHPAHRMLAREKGTEGVAQR